MAMLATCVTNAAVVNDPFARFGGNAGSHETVRHQCGKAELAIAFELVLVEGLVGRGVVWEGLVVGRVIEDVWVFAAGQRSLDVKQHAFVTIGIVNAADSVMGFGVLEAIAGAYLLDVDLDLGAEVDRAFAYGVGQIVEGVATDRNRRPVTTTSRQPRRTSS